MQDRVDEHESFIALVNQAARRSNCIRRSVGALVVRDGVVLAQGWNGVSEQYRDCREAGCPRCIGGGETGSGYETCICIHAEQHAIADAARRGVHTEGSTLYVNLRPCLQCMAIARAAGVRKVFFGGEKWTYPPELEAVYLALARDFDEFGYVDIKLPEAAKSLA